jgi:CelD/BcsL family acetyltransferase involved in cellulose biosynthesis
MSPGLAACLIEDRTGLEALGPSWWDLWRRSLGATPFQSPAWIIPWWTAFKPGRLATIAVRRAEQLVALAPMYLEEGALGRRLLPLGIGTTDYLDILLCKDVPGAGTALVRAIDELAPEWESWELEELGSGAAALSLSLPPGWREECGEQSVSPILTLSRAEPIPPKKRRKLRMAEHRIARRTGEVLPVGLAGLSSFIDDLVRLHRARWNSRGEAGAFAYDSVEEFHRTSLPRLMEAGLARVSVLHMEGSVVGAYYGLHHGSRAYAYLGGFDPDFSFESPGTVLVGRAIDTAREEGATEFHFLRGREKYKYEWGAVDCWTRRRSIRRHG